MKKLQEKEKESKNNINGRNDNKPKDDSKSKITKMKTQAMKQQRNHETTSLIKRQQTRIDIVMWKNKNELRM